ncbi:hypothetical protein BHE74_00027243 [Ensete ventricosum]|nr:hypothetical protein GW17_00037183 [Ensete ventricosum]RWW65449.1 hypothetical protein BHE74_00027243 [Ensete ventricosum]
MCARLSTSVGKRENAWLGLVEAVSRCASLGFIGGSCTKASVGESDAVPVTSGDKYGMRQSTLFQDLGWRRCPDILGGIVVPRSRATDTT